MKFSARWPDIYNSVSMMYQPDHMTLLFLYDAVIHQVYMIEWNSSSYFLDEHKSLLVKFRRLCGQTVVVILIQRRMLIIRKFPRIFLAQSDEDHEICYRVIYILHYIDIYVLFFMHILSQFLNCKVKYIYTIFIVNLFISELVLFVYFYKYMC